MQLRSRADLVRVLAQSDNDPEVAHFVGYHRELPPEKEPAIAEKGIRERPSVKPKRAIEVFKPQQSHLNWQASLFYYASLFIPGKEGSTRFTPAPEPVGYSLDELQHRELLSVKAPPRIPPLVSWPRLRPRLTRLLQESFRTRQPDVDEILRILNRGKVPSSLPFKYRKRLPGKISIWLDRSSRLVPFLEDQNALAMRLRRLVGKRNVEFYYVDDCVQSPQAFDRTRIGRQAASHLQNECVLILGDLGCLAQEQTAVRQWLLLAKQARQRNIRMLALLPAPVGRWPRELLKSCEVASWEPPAARHRQSRQLIDQRAQRLLSLCSYATWISPGLLRTVRQLMPGQADAATEADVYMHPQVGQRSAVAFTIARDAIDDLQQLFCQEPIQLQEAVASAIRNWHKSYARELWYSELLRLPKSARAGFAQEIPDAEKDVGRLAETYLNRTKSVPSRFIPVLTEWFRDLANRVSLEHAIWDEVPLLRSVFVKLEQDKEVAKMPIGYSPVEDDKPGPDRLWSVRQTGDTFTITETGAGTPDKGTTGSAVGLLRSTRPFLHCVSADVSGLVQEGHLASVFLDPQTGAVIKEQVTKPTWANDFGKDKYGLWAVLQYGDVEQRLRYIEPGKFLMGSPANEVGRWDDEKQHPVTLTGGYWLFDAPVTQALWQAVMGANPSRFKGDDRPVEQVSWKDCARFIEKLNVEIPGLGLQLPTEAQWEYACRAGTAAATYAGDLEDETKSSVLTDIAWYRANSGSDTHSVGEKNPNPWGIYDMLGNVYEWCSDWWSGDLGGKHEVDPTGPKRGTYRVFRGGGWYGRARHVRAAYRVSYGPGHRGDDVGFRCARVQDSMSSGRSVGDGGADAQAVEAPAGEGPVVFGAAGTKYIIKPEQTVAIAVHRDGRLQLQSDQGMLTVSAVTKPGWADAMGRDRFGLWLDFKYKEVEQRLRWIPPGQFLMGSPKDEAGRFDRETRHLVTLTQGYWLFDTPVTQALWQAVMGDNPSRFKSPTRPVETVSWEACAEFIEKINGELPELRLRLPTEAQWEYACRAGTTAATYAGDLDIKGLRDAPLLHEIAWYGGNSAVDFELEERYDSSDWKEKQYDHKKAGTHPVGLKRPNPWGLYDMLGNVYEWCEDRWIDDFGDQPALDPAGPEQGTDRVIRGGSWISIARGVRAAYRDRYVPGFRHDLIGFRCARVQEA